jgi:hypothetical protein
MSSQSPLHSPGAKMREIRVAPSTYVVIGCLSAMFLFLGIGFANEHLFLGVVLVVAAILIFWHYCFQTITLDGDILSYRRPFFAPVRFSLSNVTHVSTVWTATGKGSYRRWLFHGGNVTLCAFTPKPFSLADLAFILEEVQKHAPSAVLDEDTQTFLPIQSQ